MERYEAEIDRMVAEVHRLDAAGVLVSERQGDESPEHFVMRKVLEASGLTDQLKGAVGAIREAEEALWPARHTGTRTAEAHAILSNFLASLNHLGGGSRG